MNITTGPELVAFAKEHGLASGYLKAYFQISPASASNILAGRQWTGAIPTKYRGLTAELAARYNGVETALASPIAAPVAVEPTEGEGVAPKRPARRRSKAITVEAAGDQSAPPITVETTVAEVVVDPVAEVVVDAAVAPVTWTNDELIAAAMEALGEFDVDGTNGEADSQGTDDPPIEEVLDEWVAELTEPPSPTDLSDAIANMAASGRATEEHAAHLAGLISDKFYPDESKADRRERRGRLTRVFKIAIRPTKAERADHDEPDRPDPNALPTEEERAAIREELWPRVQELAMRPDVLSEAMRMVHALGFLEGPRSAQMSQILQGSSLA